MKIFWSQDAADELTDIITYTIEHFDKKQANIVFTKIAEKVERIKHYPHQGKIVPELREIGINDIRQILELPWKIFYKTENETLYILTIIDSRRNIEEILYKKIIDGKLK